MVTKELFRVMFQIQISPMFTIILTIWIPQSKDEGHKRNHQLREEGWRCIRKNIEPWNHVQLRINIIFSSHLHVKIITLNYESSAESTNKTWESNLTLQYAGLVSSHEWIKLSDWINCNLKLNNIHYILSIVSTSFWSAILIYFTE